MNAIIHKYDGHTREEWAAALNAMHSGTIFECDQSFFYYWLEVLPPARMGYEATLPDGSTVRAWFGFAEGAEHITAFWMTGSQSDDTARFYGCRTNEINTYN